MFLTRYNFHLAYNSAFWGPLYMECICDAALQDIIFYNKA